MKKIDYRSGEDCLHLTYKDMKNMTIEDAIFILSESVDKFQNAKDDNYRINLPRPRIIKAYEIAIECMKNSLS